MHVHVEDSRALPEEVVVQRRHLETVVQQRRHHRVYFVFREHEIAHHHGTSGVSGRERQPPAEPEGRRDRAARNRDSEVAAGKVYAADVVLEVTLSAERLEHGGAFGRNVRLAAQGGGVGQRYKGNASAAFQHVVILSASVER